MDAKRKLAGLAVAMCVTATAPQGAFAQQGCEDALFKKGANYRERDNGLWTITYVGSAAVSFDDVDAIEDAYDQAELAAQRGIAAWLKTNIQDDREVSRIVDESNAMAQVPGGEAEKAAIRRQKVDRIKRLSSSTDAVLRGVLTIDDCYLKGREVRVVVGLKPETVAAADNAAGTMGQSLVNNPTPTNQNTSNSRQYAPNAPSNDSTAGDQSRPAPGTSASGSNSGLRGMEGTNDASRVRDF